ncbi:MAG: hypothetical protein AUG51_21210 [Acidobacteria bacterium 13_1_20CM_3_53_8]|nr:MAG: hypothetical protein AUG51_21210 [Acidobacteria bacterium 13_1_20CM_3_53_8]
MAVRGYEWGVTHRSISAEDPTFNADSVGRRPNTQEHPINTVGDPVNTMGIPVNTSPVRPQGTIPVQRSPIPLGNPEIVETVEVQRETYVLVKNSGNKIIKAIDWDYVFFSDEAMEHEVKRHKFRTRKKIAPGASKFLSEYVEKRAASRYQRVFINRVEFADGSVWLRQ